MGVSLDSHSLPIVLDFRGHKVVSLTYDSYSNKVYGNSLDGMASSLDSFKALLLDDVGEKDHAEFLICPSHFG